jgi:hypothetical protein
MEDFTKEVVWLMDIDGEVLTEEEWRERFEEATAGMTKEEVEDAGAEIGGWTEADFDSLIPVVKNAEGIWVEAE